MVSAVHVTAAVAYVCIGLIILGVALPYMRRSLVILSLASTLLCVARAYAAITESCDVDDDGFNVATLASVAGLSLPVHVIIELCSFTVDDRSHDAHHHRIRTTVSHTTLHTLALLTAIALFVIVTLVGNVPVERVAVSASVGVFLFVLLQVSLEFRDQRHAHLTVSQSRSFLFAMAEVAAGLRLVAVAIQTVSDTDSVQDTLCDAEGLRSLFQVELLYGVELSLMLLPATALLWLVTRPETQRLPKALSYSGTLCVLLLVGALVAFRVDTVRGLRDDNVWLSESNATYAGFMVARVLSVLCTVCATIVLMGQHRLVVHVVFGRLLGPAFSKDIADNLPFKVHKIVGFLLVACALGHFFGHIAAQSSACDVSPGSTCNTPHVYQSTGKLASSFAAVTGFGMLACLCGIVVSGVALFRPLGCIPQLTYKTFHVIHAGFISVFVLLYVFHGSARHFGVEPWNGYFIAVVAVLAIGLHTANRLLFPLHVHHALAARVGNVIVLRMFSPGNQAEPAPSQYMLTGGPNHQETHETHPFSIVSHAHLDLRVVELHILCRYVDPTKHATAAIKEAAEATLAAQPASPPEGTLAAQPVPPLVAVPLGEAAPEKSAPGFQTPVPPVTEEAAPAEAGEEAGDSKEAAHGSDDDETKIDVGDVIARMRSRYASAPNIFHQRLRAMSTPAERLSFSVARLRAPEEIEEASTVMTEEAIEDGMLGVPEFETVELEDDGGGNITVTCDTSRVFIRLRGPFNGPLSGSLADTHLYQGFLLHAVGVGVTPVLSAFCYMSREVAGLNDVHRPNRLVDARRITFTWVTANRQHMHYVLGLVVPLLARVADALATDAPHAPVTISVVFLLRQSTALPAELPPAPLDDASREAFSSRLWMATGGHVDDVVDQSVRTRPKKGPAPPAVDVTEEDPSLPPGLTLSARYKWVLSPNVKAEAREYVDGGRQIAAAYEPVVGPLYGDPAVLKQRTLALFCGGRGTDSLVHAWRRLAEPHCEVNYATETF